MPLADRFLTLERIHLSWCDKITVRAIAYLLNRLPLLTHLSLSGIPAFKTAELQRFCRAPPDGLNDGQRGSFCVYSGPGVAALRNYLNSQVTGPELSDASSGRRSSASSTSSITIPGSASRGTAWDQGTDRPAAESRRDTPDQTSVGDVSGNAAMGHMFNLFKAASQSAPEHRQVSNGSRRPGLWETLENISLNEGSSSSQAVSGSTWNDTLTAPEAPSAEPSSSFTTVPSASEPTATTPSERPVQQPSSYAEDRSPLHNSGSSSYVASHTPQVVQPDTSSDMPTRERTVSARGRSENERILRYL